MKVDFASHASFVYRFQGVQWTFGLICGDNPMLGRAEWLLPGAVFTGFIEGVVDTGVDDGTTAGGHFYTCVIYINGYPLRTTPIWARGLKELKERCRIIGDGAIHPEIIGHPIIRHIPFKTRLSLWSRFFWRCISGGADKIIH